MSFWDAVMAHLMRLSWHPTNGCRAWYCEPPILTAMEFKTWFGTGLSRVQGYPNDRYLVAQGLGNGMFTVTSTLVPPLGSYDRFSTNIAVGDFNGDDFPDFAVRVWIHNLDKAESRNLAERSRRRTRSCRSPIRRRCLPSTPLTMASAMNVDPTW